MYDVLPDMEFVKKFTPSDFQEKIFTPSISPNFNGFSKKKHKKMIENGEICTAGKYFTLPPALTALTNSTSDVRSMLRYYVLIFCILSCILSIKLTAESRQNQTKSQELLKLPVTRYLYRYRAALAAKNPNF